LAQAGIRDPVQLSELAVKIWVRRPDPVNELLTGASLFPACLALIQTLLLCSAY